MTRERRKADVFRRRAAAVRRNCSGGGSNVYDRHS
jgi:hypothetical protein